MWTVLFLDKGSWSLTKSEKCLLQLCIIFSEFWREAKGSRFNKKATPPDLYYIDKNELKELPPIRRNKFSRYIDRILPCGMCFF